MALPMNSGLPAFTRMPWMAAAALAVSVLALLPLGFVLWVAVQSGWQTVLTLVFRPRVAELLILRGDMPRSLMAGKSTPKN